MNNFKANTKVQVFKEYTEITEKHRETFNHISSLFHTIIGGTNDVANSIMLDAINEIKKAGLLKQKVKKMCKAAIERYSIFEKQNMGDMKNAEINKQQLYMDFLDSVDKRTRNDIFILRQSVKRLLDKNAIENSDLKSFILTAHALLIFSIELFDRFIDTCPPCPPINLGKTYRDARLTSVKNAWEQVENIICPDCKEINLTKDKDCKLAMEILETKLVSEQGINESGMEALNLNPDAQLEADRKVLQYDKKRFQKIVLTEAQKKHIIENYHTTRKADLAKTIGIGLTKLREVAKEIGLLKVV